MNKYSSPLLMLAPCAAILLACNSNSGDDNAANGGDTPGAAFGTGGMFGTGGDTTGTGSTIDTGSGGAGSMMQAVGCNGGLCGDPTANLPPQIAKLIPAEMKPVACCDPITMMCGTATSTGACVPVPPPDSRCPPIMVGAVNAPTCCSGSQRCGFYVSASLPCTVFDIPSLPPAACSTMVMGSGGMMGTRRHDGHTAA